MLSWKGIVSGAIGAGLMFASAALAADVEAPGKVQSVTLYRGQALVTRAVSVEAPAGMVQLVVTDLPERLQPESLYATAEKGAQVRAVRYRTRPVGQAPREAVQKLDDQIAAVQKDIRKNEADQQRLVEQKDYLTKLQNFVAPTAQVEITKGVLDDKTLTGLTTFIFTQTASMSDERLALSEKHDDLEKQLSLLNRQRDQLTTSNTKTAREAVVFLEKEGANATQVMLSYIVTSATWSPAYNLRTTAEMKDVQVEYNAIIQQMSGEDWESATLTLATASPNLSSDAPLLAPMLVALSRQAQGQLLNLPPMGKDATLQTPRQMAQHGIASDNRQRAQSDWELNVASNSAQGFELAAPQESVREIQQSLRGEVTGLSASYKLAAPVSLASRSDQQIVRIADLTLPAVFSHVAIPLLTDSVYRQAEITNNSEISLLEGTTTAYMNGDFVGKGTIPVVASGQRFTAGFGADAQVRALREFVSKAESIQGGNKEITYTYRLVMENYKDKPVALRALDRIPYTQPDIRVTLGEMKLGDTKPKVSEDAEYQRTLLPKGILRWDIVVPAKVSGANAAALEYGYKLEYDRNMSVVPVTAGEQQQELRDLMEIQMKAY